MVVRGSIDLYMYACHATYILSEHCIHDRANNGCEATAMQGLTKTHEVVKWHVIVRFVVG